MKTRNRNLKTFFFHWKENLFFLAKFDRASKKIVSFPKSPSHLQNQNKPSQEFQYEIAFKSNLLSEINQNLFKISRWWLEKKSCPKCVGKDVFLLNQQTSAAVEDSVWCLCEKVGCSKWQIPASNFYLFSHSNRDFRTQLQTLSHEAKIDDVQCDDCIMI